MRCFCVIDGCVCVLRVFGAVFVQVLDQFLDGKKGAMGGSQLLFFGFPFSSCYFVRKKRRNAALFVLFFNMHDVFFPTADRFFVFKTFCVWLSPFFFSFFLFFFFFYFFFFYSLFFFLFFFFFFFFFLPQLRVAPRHARIAPRNREPWRAHQRH
jgi:hypothetical protein